VLLKEWRQSCVLLNKIVRAKDRSILGVRVTQLPSIYRNPVALLFDFRNVVLGILSLFLINYQVVNYFLQLVLFLSQSAVTKTYILD
jgi:hypothetical protein